MLTDHDWRTIKSEDSPTIAVSTSASLGPGVYLSNAEKDYGQGHGISRAESERVVAQLPTSSERQRTAQACDKCRERKTKCSGDHPVCHRCTTRGLICQYSSREPRPRGPSKARLRNAVSSTELRSSAIPQVPQRTQHVRPVTHMRHYRPEDYGDNGTTSYHPHRVSSHPRSYDDSSFLSVSNSVAYETFQVPPQLYDGHFYASSHPTTQYPQAQMQCNHMPFGREVRRVQSHSSLIGSARSQYSLPSPITYSNNIGGPTSYDQFSPHGCALERPTDQSSGTPHYENQLAKHSVEITPWGYHSDGGSSGSEHPSQGEINFAYSPSSSDGAPEPSPRSASRVGVVSSGPFDFSHMVNDPPTHEFDIGEGVYADHSRIACRAPSPGDHYDDMIPNPNRETRAGFELMYPSPITPIGTSIIHDNTGRDVIGKQGLYEYVGAEGANNGHSRGVF